MFFTVRGEVRPRRGRKSPGGGTGARQETWPRLGMRCVTAGITETGGGNGASCVLEDGLRKEKQHGVVLKKTRMCAFLGHTSIVLEQ